jgi:hypothetical protein
MSAGSSGQPTNSATSKSGRHHNHTSALNEDQLPPLANEEEANALIAELKALQRHVMVLKKEIDMDSRERRTVEESLNIYLLAAINEFSEMLQLSPSLDVDEVFLIVHLWLSNWQSSSVNSAIETVVENVPSFKFVALTYQILSRMGSGGESDQSVPVDVSSASSINSSRFVSGRPPHGALSSSSTDRVQPLQSDFQRVLNKLVLRLCTDHPFHTLPQLFALSQEGDLGGVVTAMSAAAQHTPAAAASSRSLAAANVVARLKANPATKSVVENTHVMLMAYIDLAKASTEDIPTEGGRVKDMKFRKIQQRGKLFNECLSGMDSHSLPALLTVNCKLSAVRNYSDVVKAIEFSPTFSLTDHGISRPKIVTCIGTDGKFYKQLVKGGDDTRQDAVMQQVFENLNYTLNRDADARKRNLSIRTYKIIPTTPQTGVLQWVENTLPFGAVLCDRDIGVHPRYYPNDWSHNKCREHLKDITDNHDKELHFAEICEHFNPAFRFFLLETYSDPAEWMTGRLAYTRSVAAASIAGYVLGIGDRHAHNILVSKLAPEIRFGVSAL